MIPAALLLMLAQTPDAVNDRAQALAQSGRAEEAAALWRQLPESYFPAAFNLGYFHVSRQEFAAALPYLERAARLQPGDFNAHFLLGQAHSRQGQRDAALRAWRKALALQPAHARLLSALAVEYGLGGYYREAAAAAKRLLAVNPGDLNAHLLAIKACQEADDPAGPALARAATEKFPQSARAWFEQAWYLQRAGNTAESAKLLDRAIALDPAYEEPLFFRGNLLLEEGDAAGAVPVLRQALRLRPEYTSAAVTLGRALMELGSLAEARDVLEAAGRAAPLHPQPPLMLARVYQRLGDEGKAREAKELSLRLRRANAALLEKAQSRDFRP